MMCREKQSKKTSDGLSSFHLMPGPYQSQNEAKLRWQPACSPPQAPTKQNTFSSLNMKWKKVKLDRLCQINPKDPF